tara:strand:- start:202 stop:549 length:348 start_codon:yes stop_codon:yes gene_type:complete
MQNLKNDKISNSTSIFLFSDIYKNPKILKSNYLCTKTIKKACQLSKSLNKPIKLNYYLDSLKQNVCITSHKNDKIIYKNHKEYTKPIKNTFKINQNYIVVTEDTINIISTKIKYF